MLDWLTPDLGRWINVVLSAACLVLMALKFRWWLALPRGRRFHWASSFAFCLSVGYGTLEVLFHASVTFRVAALTFALLWQVLALVYADRPKPGNPEG